MTQARLAPSTACYDVVGVGFGPSNLALAIAIEEFNAESSGMDSLQAVFCERKPSLEWHGDMLLDGTKMQVSFVKDLTTLRNPTSRYSFLSYLHHQDRLVDFVNHRTLFPSRAEFHDYLEWAGAGFAHQVHYGHEAVDVQPVSDNDGRVSALEVIATRPGEPDRPMRWRTRNLVVAAGLEPALPPGIQPSGRVWHSAQTLSRLAEIPPESEVRFVVWGAGQSAAEVVEHLHSRYRRAEVYAIVSRYGYRPADDSQFVNRIFDPAAVDTFFGSPPNVKETILEDHANTNYSAVDQELIGELFRRAYEERVRAVPRLHFLSLSRMVDVRTASDAAELSIEYLPTGRVNRLRADFLVCATGYRPVDPLRWMDGTRNLCKRDDKGRLMVERDYRVMTADKVECGIYVQGCTEHTHGLSSSLLSNVATRAGELVSSMTGRRSGRVRPAAPGGPTEGE